MGAFVSYMLQVAVVMTLLYLAYKWVMSPTTFHRMNRLTLLGIYAVSWTLPFAAAWLSRVSAPTPEIEVGLPVMTEFVSVTVSEEAGTDWARVALWVYMVGVAVTALFAAFGFARMLYVIYSGRRTRREGYIEVVSDKAPGPFSWGRYVVLRPCDCDADMPMVTAHELAHLRRRHWLDLALAQATAVLQWFSPVAWLMMRDVKDVHEFEVDAEVAGDSPADYQMMLLKKTVGAKFPAFADSLNHSQIKKRITMMMTKKSSPSRRVAALALPAAAALAVFMLSQPAVASVADSLAGATVADNRDGKVNESPANLQVAGKVVSIRATETPRVAADGAAGAVATVETEAAAETESGSAEEPQKAAEEKKTPEPPAYFVDGKKYDGHLTDLDPNQIASMSIVKDDPAYPQGKIMITTKGAGSGETVRYANEKLAEFKGGQQALMQFLAENIKWPEGAQVPDKPATVIVSFTIGTDGSVTDTEVKRGQGEAFDAEAVRVVRLTSGKWKPASDGGKPVASRFTIPIRFSR